MKIALCISGEIRNFNDDFVKNSYYNFLNKLYPNSFDIFISVWNHVGFSYNYKRENPLKNRNDIDNKIEDIILSRNNVIMYEIEEYDAWLKSIDNKIIDLMKYPLIGGESVTSPPQLYKIYKCNEMKKKYEKENNFKYDLVIRTRPDVVYIDDLDFSDIESINHINFGILGSYWPDRIFDIFFYSNSENMDKISLSWMNILNDIDYDFDNGLDKRDSGRLLYISSLRNGINVKNLNRRICAVYRNEPLEQFYREIDRMNG